MKLCIGIDDSDSASTPQDLHLRHSAYHESGHIAVALFIGCLVREAYVYDQRGSYAGYTKFDIPRSETKEGAALKACIVGLAGIAAALKSDACRDPRANGDKERVDKILCGFPASDRPILYKECESKASELVTLLWPQICELAMALESRQADANGKRILGQHEVLNIYESKGRGDSTLELSMRIG